MAIMNQAKFHSNRLMLTFIFGIRASEPPPPLRAWRMTEKAGPDTVNLRSNANNQDQSGLGQCRKYPLLKKFVISLLPKTINQICKRYNVENI